MDRIIMVQRGIVKDRLKIWQDALGKLNGDTSYQGLMVRISENTAFVDGPVYKKERVKYRKQYQKLVKELGVQ